jgi:hypothetical protein
VRARPAAVVRLEGALALAHGRLSRRRHGLGPGRRSLKVLGRWCGARCRRAAIAGLRWCSTG